MHAGNVPCAHTARNQVRHRSHACGHRAARPHGTQSSAPPLPCMRATCRAPTRHAIKCATAPMHAGIVPRAHTAHIQARPRSHACGHRAARPHGTHSSAPPRCRAHANDSTATATVATHSKKVSECWSPYTINSDNSFSISITVASLPFAADGTWVRRPSYRKLRTHSSVRGQGGPRTTGKEPAAPCTRAHT